MVAPQHENESNADEKETRASPRKRKAKATELIAPVREEARPEQIPSITPVTAWWTSGRTVPLGKEAQNSPRNRAEHCQDERAVNEEASHATVPRPNGSRLSCGRRVRGRKAVERQTKRLGGEATEFFLTCERPPGSNAC